MLSRSDLPAVSLLCECREAVYRAVPRPQATAASCPRHSTGGNWSSDRTPAARIPSAARCACSAPPRRLQRPPQAPVPAPTGCEKPTGLLVGAFELARPLPGSVKVGGFRRFARLCSDGVPVASCQDAREEGFVASRPDAREEGRAGTWLGCPLAEDRSNRCCWPAAMSRRI